MPGDIRMNFDGLKDSVVRTLLVHLGYLSCTINLAFYFAREYYTIVREMPGGKGFADVCFIPRRLYGDKPAAVIELKWNESAEGAIAQIKERRYVEALKDYRGNLLLAGINYDKKTKTHSCVIERVENFIQVGK